MSDQSLLDTATDFPAGRQPAGRPPWRAGEAAGWALAAGLVAGGILFAGLSLWRLLVGPFGADIQLPGGPLLTAGVFATATGACGLVVGTLAGLISARVSGARAVLAWGFGLGLAAALAGGAFPVVAGATKPWPPGVGSALVWAFVGAVVGVAGYTWGRRPNATGTVDWPGEDRPTWSLAGAAGWGAAVGLVSASAWLAELTVFRLLPDPIPVRSLVGSPLFDTAALFAMGGGGLGLLVGAASGLLLGRPSRLRAAVVRGLAFATAAAASGALVPVAAATVTSLAPEVSSTLIWLVVGAIAGVVGYGATHRPRRPAEAGPIDGADDIRLVPVAGGMTRGFAQPANPPAPTVPALLAGHAPELRAGEDAAVTSESGWDPVAVVIPDHGRLPNPPRVQPADRAVTAGPVVRVVPVLLVSVGCLLAVGLGAPSPVGWAMLAVGLLGLAVASAVVGQERRIRELELRLGDREAGGPR
jgi:hypothetical protein